MQKDDLIYINHILTVMERITRDLINVNFDQFSHDEILQDAMVRRIEIIGEATKHISEILKSENKHIPWKDIAGMRDKLIHNYLNVDFDLVWITITKDIPNLKMELDKMTGHTV